MYEKKEGNLTAFQLSLREYYELYITIVVTCFFYISKITKYII